VAQYIRVKWLEKGFNPEDTRLERLVKWAVRFERSQSIIDRLTSGANSDTDN
jgi:hypothetical protein